MMLLMTVMVRVLLTSLRLIMTATGDVDAKRGNRVRCKCTCRCASSAMQTVLCCRLLIKWPALQPLDFNPTGVSPQRSIHVMGSLAADRVQDLPTQHKTNLKPTARQDSCCAALFAASSSIKPDRAGR